MNNSSSDGGVLSKNGYVCNLQQGKQRTAFDNIVKYVGEKRVFNKLKEENEKRIINSQVENKMLNDVANYKIIKSELWWKNSILYVSIAAFLILACILLICYFYDVLYILIPTCIVMYFVIMLIIVFFVHKSRLINSYEKKNDRIYPHNKDV